MRKNIFIFIVFILIHNVAHASEIINQSVVDGCDDSFLYSQNGNANVYAVFEKNANMSFLVTQNLSNGCDVPTIYPQNGNASIHALFEQDPDFSKWFIRGSNIAEGCKNEIIHPTNGSVVLRAYYQPIYYTCATGYYLPANNLGCVECPNGYTCSGGTFEFNEKYPGGIQYPQPVSDNVPHGCDYKLLKPTSNPRNKMVAMFEPNTYTCNVGYYLPENRAECVICPQNSYCAGGSYVFNKYVPQGIESCPDYLYTPAGMWQENQCGRRLHIGNDIVYLHRTRKTSPSLNVDIDHDGVADFFGNMTPLDVPMTNGTTHKLKIKFNDVIHSVYDDSVDLSGYENQ